MAVPTRACDHMVSTFRLVFQDQGVQVEKCMKAVIFADGATFVEVRLLLDMFYTGTTVKWQTHRFLKDNDALLREVADDIGAVFDDVVKPPSRSYALKNPVEAATNHDPYVMEDCHTEQLAIQ